MIEPDASMPLYAAASLACASPERNRMIASSRDCGWRALLLDHQEGLGSVDAYDKPVTPDLCVTAALTGTYCLSVRRHGHWIDAVHRPGTVGTTRGGDADRLRWRTRHPDRSFSVGSLYIPHRTLAEAADHFRRPGVPSPVEPTSELLLVDHIVASAIRTLIDMMPSDDADLYAEQTARWLAAHLIWTNKGRLADASDYRSPGVISDRRLARVIEYISEHFARPLTLADLADVAGVSPFHFCRLFQRATGATPQRFLTEHRMRTAQRLLNSSDLSVAEVARKCGYRRATSFATAYSRTFGVPPSSCRLH